MLIINGATGKLGRKIVQNLLQRVPAERIAVSVRDPSMADDLKESGVRVRQGDYNNAATLRHAWEGAQRLLLVSSNAAASGGDPLAQHATAISVAQELAVERVYYMSQIASSAVSHFRRRGPTRPRKRCWLNQVCPGPPFAMDFMQTAPSP